MQEDALERTPARGVLEVLVKRNGAVVERWREENLIVNGARNKAARLFAGEGDAADHRIAKIAFGTSGKAAEASDAALANQYSKGLAGIRFPGMGQVEASWELGVDEANGMAIMELGLLSGDGTLLCRKARDRPISKDVDISVEGKWTWTF